ncbi:MAG: HEAT repeat domain-containing protein [Gemmataceae bacterium]
MQATLLHLAGLGMLLAQTACEPDLAQLQEVLSDRQDPRGQSQAALLLVQSADPEAEVAVRRGLRQLESEETFVALAAAVRLRPDDRFVKELLAGLGAARPRVRQAAAETLAALTGPGLVLTLHALLRDPRADLRVRQMALWTLGRCGRKEAAGVLVEALGHDNEELRRVAASAPTDLTGQALGPDAARWKAWWAKHKDLPTEQWLSLRLSFQTTRAQRLEGELARARAQVLRLHQQVYSRLPAAERFAHLQSMLDQDDAGVRALAVGWAVELLPGADGDRRQALAKVLVRLTHDPAPEVQREAVVALGRLPDDAAFDRLHELLKDASPAVRAAATRAMSLHARGRMKQALPLLRKALEDDAPQVVVEAAEALGMLGAPEAGPVLIGLLKHPAEHVRQTAAQALERTADAGLIDDLVRGLDAPAVTVRFGLLGALAKAAGNGQALSREARQRVHGRLEVLLKTDPDAGVRSRAATVLGECGTPDVLPMLWEQVQTNAEERVREKAWDAFVEVLTRAANLPLIEGWDRSLRDAKQDTRRVQLWSKVHARWDQVATTRDQAAVALEGLARAHLDLGKWSAAAPLLQGLLSRGGEAEALRSRCLKALAEAAGLALKEGHRAEALRLVREARAYLAKGDKLAEEFDKLEKQAGAQP